MKESYLSNKEGDEQILRLELELKVLKRLGTLEQSPFLNQKAKDRVFDLRFQLSTEDSPMNLWFQDRLSRIGMSLKTFENIQRIEEYIGSENVLGPDAILTAELLFRDIPTDVEFFLEQVPDLSFVKEDIEHAKHNNEMLVLDVGSVYFNDSQRQNPQAITFSLIKKMFRFDPFDPDDTLFRTIHGYTEVESRKECSWAFSRKNPSSNPIAKSFSDYLNLLKEKDYYNLFKDDYDRWSSGYQVGILRALTVKSSDSIFQAFYNRRTLWQAVWETLLKYTVTGKRLLEKNIDFVECADSQHNCPRGGWVGGFDATGLKFSDTYFSTEGAWDYFEVERKIMEKYQPAIYPTRRPAKE